MSISLLKELRFTIGEQYELNEFNLKVLESTFKNDLEYENYEYIKDDFKTLFGIAFLSNIELQYNGDILYKVTYTFERVHYKYFYPIIDKCSFKDVLVEILIIDRNTCQIVLKKKKKAHF